VPLGVKAIYKNSQTSMNDVLFTKRLDIKYENYEVYITRKQGTLTLIKK